MFTTKRRCQTHVENKTCQITRSTLKSDIEDEGRFRYRPKKTIIDQVIEDKRSLINLYIEQHADQIGEKLLQRYETYQAQIDENPEFRKQLEMEIGGFLLDMKEVIANDEKTRRLLEQVEGGHFDLSEDIIEDSDAPQ